MSFFWFCDSQRDGNTLNLIRFQVYASTWNGDMKNTSCHQGSSFFLYTSANASSITRALRGPWPQRGVEFVARECCEHSFASENVADCYQESHLGASYNGLKHTTDSGLECAKWRNTAERTSFVSEPTRRRTVPRRSRGVSLLMASAHRRSVVSVCARRPNEISGTRRTIFVSEGEGAGLQLH